MPQELTLYTYRPLVMLHKLIDYKRTSLRRTPNVYHRIRNQQVSLNSLDTLHSLAVDKNRTRQTFCASWCATYSMM